MPGIQRLSLPVNRTRIADSYPKVSDRDALNRLMTMVVSVLFGTTANVQCHFNHPGRPSHALLENCGRVAQIVLLNPEIAQFTTPERLPVQILNVGERISRLMSLGLDEFHAQVEQFLHEELFGRYALEDVKQAIAEFSPGLSLVSLARLRQDYCTITIAGKPIVEFTDDNRLAEAIVESGLNPHFCIIVMRDLLAIGFNHQIASWGFRDVIELTCSELRSLSAQEYCNRPAAERQANLILLTVKEPHKLSGQIPERPAAQQAQIDKVNRELCEGVPAELAKLGLELFEELRLMSGQHPIRAGQVLRERTSWIIDPEQRGVVINIALARRSIHCTQPTFEIKSRYNAPNKGDLLAEAIKDITDPQIQARILKAATAHVAEPDKKWGFLGGAAARLSPDPLAFGTLLAALTADLSDPQVLGPALLAATNDSFVYLLERALVLGSATAHIANEEVRNEVTTRATTDIVDEEEREAVLDIANSNIHDRATRDQLIERYSVVLMRLPEEPGELAA